MTLWNITGKLIFTSSLVMGATLKFNVAGLLPQAGQSGTFPRIRTLKISLQRDSRSPTFAFLSYAVMSAVCRAAS